MNGRVGKYNPAKKPSKVDVLTVEQIKEIQCLAKGFRVGNTRAAAVAACNAVRGEVTAKPTKSRRATKARRAFARDPAPVIIGFESAAFVTEQQRLAAQKLRQQAWFKADRKAEQQEVLREYRRKRALRSLVRYSAEGSCSEGECCMLQGQLYHATATRDSVGRIADYTPAELIYSADLRDTFAGGACDIRYPGACSDADSSGSEEEYSVQSPVFMTIG
jgi:hypothetical protein